MKVRIRDREALLAAPQVIQGHREEAVVVMTGDLERGGRPWRLLNPYIVNVIRNEDAPRKKNSPGFRQRTDVSGPG